jgi:hypothetical protein
MAETLLEAEERDIQVPDASSPCTAELAECTCPDFCERDHDNE